MAAYRVRSDSLPSIDRRQKETHVTTANVFESIRDFRFEPAQWLWCLHCERFFQGRDARADALGGQQACAFDECTGAGYCVAIFDWDHWPMGDAEAMLRWPAERDLRHGLVTRAWDDARESEYLAGDEASPALLGVGRALNQDIERRDEILGIYSREDIEDVTPFRDLDVVRLERLVEERFIPCGRVIEKGPSAEEALAFMTRFPCVRADGYAVHVARSDYRVTIDTMRCELDTVPPARREELTVAFREAFESGAELIANDELLFAWWD